MSARVVVGDCVKVMAGMPSASVDAIVTDPPYGLKFMGVGWDSLDGRDGDGQRRDHAERMDKQAGNHNPVDGADAARTRRTENRRMQEWHERWAHGALRVLKPGGHLLAFGGTRTYHRLVCALEDAGFEIRDCIVWLYGSGFPKSLDVSKAIDKAAGMERTEVVGVRRGHEDFIDRTDAHAAGARREGWDRPWKDDPEAVRAHHLQTAPATDEAARWDGWGTALKPGHEPIIVARKPLAGTVAATVLEHGTGALNVDGCRIGEQKAVPASPSQHDSEVVYGSYGVGEGRLGSGFDPGVGRWPANVVLAHSEDCVRVGTREVRADGHFPAARGASGYGSAVEDSNGGGLKGQDDLEERHFDGEPVELWACVPGCPVRMLDENGGDHGGPSRFFYCAKASRAERGAGLDGFTEVESGKMEDDAYEWATDGRGNPRGPKTRARNPHPTVKPIDLMRWLVRLVTPPAGVVLDPFAGSGSTGCAALLEGFAFVGIEQREEYAELARARLAFWREHPTGLPVDAALEADARRRDVREAGQLELM